MKIEIQKKTDQLNYEDFLGGVTRTVTIAGVRKGTAEQQYDILIEGDKRVWRPAVTVLKLLVEAWGDEASDWTGRRAVLYGDPEVRFGKEVVGGIRISHLSHIDKAFTVTLTITRGKRKPYRVEPLATAPAPSPTETAIAAFAALGITTEQLVEKFGNRTPDTWTDADLTELRTIYSAIKDGSSTIDTEFPDTLPEATS